jgi:hypothetical protein
VPRFWKLDLDTDVVTQLSSPAVDGTRMDQRELHLGASNGKVIFIFTPETTGEVANVLVYDPATDAWTPHAFPPELQGNAIASDGKRVMFCGGAFGKSIPGMFILECV